jgi:hypothetical protein
MLDIFAARCKHVWTRLADPTAIADAPPRRAIVFALQAMKTHTATTSSAATAAGSLLVLSVLLRSTQTTLARSHDETIAPTQRQFEQKPEGPCFRGPALKHVARSGSSAAINAKLNAAPVTLTSHRKRETKTDQLTRRPAGKATKRRPCDFRGAVARFTPTSHLTASPDSRI